MQRRNRLGEVSSRQVDCSASLTRIDRAQNVGKVESRTRKEVHQAEAGSCFAQDAVGRGVLGVGDVGKRLMQVDGGNVRDEMSALGDISG